MAFTTKNNWPLACFLCFCFLTQLLVASQVLQQEPLQLRDTDSYMRLVRVEQLAATGDWFDHTIARGNAPYGDVSHWSRLLDVLLLGGAWLGSFWLPFKEALFWWAVVINPLLQLLSLIVLFWAARPLLSGDGRFRLGLLFWGQSGIWAYFAFAKPDHHSLLIFLFALFLGFAMRMVRRPGRVSAACGAGTVVAFAMWVSVEPLAVVAVAWLTLGFLCLQRPQRGHFYARQGAAFSLSLLGGAALALLVERGWEQLWVVEFDKLSVAQLGIFAWGSAYWLCLWRYPPQRRLQNLAVTGACCAAGLAAAWYWCPDLLKGPFAAVDKRIIPIWLARVQEVQPLWPVSWKNLSRFTEFLGLSFFVFPYYGWLWRQKRLQGVQVLWLVGSAIFVVLTCYQVRWMTYAEVVLIFPATMLLMQLLSRVETCNFSLGSKALLRVSLTVFFCLGPWGIGALLYDEKPTAGVTVTELAAVLSDDTALGAGSKIILANIDFGPELLYRTPHRVITAPYHRNGEGIFFAHQVMASVKDEEAWALLRQRGVDWLLLCPSSSEGGYFNPNQDPASLYARLLQGERPAWLQPLPLPAELAETFYLYQVRYEEI